MSVCVVLGGVLFIYGLFVYFQETKPSSQDGGDKKDGEYIKLKVIGQVCMCQMILIMLSYIFLVLFCYIFFLYRCHCRVSSREELETVRVKAVTLHCLIRNNQFVLLSKTLTKHLHICICRILGVYIYNLIVNKVYIN